MYKELNLLNFRNFLTLQLQRSSSVFLFIYHLVLLIYYIVHLIRSVTLVPMNSTACVVDVYFFKRRVMCYTGIPLSRIRIRSLIPMTRGTRVGVSVITRRGMLLRPFLARPVRFPGTTMITVIVLIVVLVIMVQSLEKCLQSLVVLRSRCRNGRLINQRSL